MKKVFKKFTPYLGAWFVFVGWICVELNITMLGWLILVIWANSR